MTTKLTDTQIQAMLDGCKGVTPGPYQFWGGHHVMGALDDGAWSIFASSSCPTSPTSGHRFKVWERDAAHIARCDPETIAAAMTELIERRKGDSAIVEACAKVAEAEAARWGDEIGSSARCAADQIRALAPPAPAAEPVAYQTMKDGKWVECSEFVAKGWGDAVADGCRPLYVSPPAPAVTLTREQIAKVLAKCRFPSLSDAEVDAIFARYEKRPYGMDTESMLAFTTLRAADAILTAQRGVAVTREQDASPNEALVKALNDLHVWCEREGCGDQAEIIKDAFKAAGITEYRCECCDGLGEWDEGPLPATSSQQISPDYRHMVCSDCDGKGAVALPRHNRGGGA